MDNREKNQVIREFRVHETDVGSPEVQVAILTRRVAELTEHLKVHRGDHASRRGLIAMVSRRTKLLRYLRGRSFDRYRDIVSKLSLRR